jgi:hypothetical protein
MVLKWLSKKHMVIPFIALIAIIVLVIVFLSKAGKRKSEGKDMGEPGKGTI